VQVTSPATAFFGKTYGEAVVLLEEARNYLAYVEPRERDRLPPLDRLRVTQETMRLTARLTQIMAWLLAQRAVQAGEMSQRQALGDQASLAEIDVCMEAEGVEGVALPPGLLSLLDRSLRLYQRVARLDELARRQSQ
jgi:regulator of CtrA degradation